MGDLLSSCCNGVQTDPSHSSDANTILKGNEAAEAVDLRNEEPDQEEDRKMAAVRGKNRRAGVAAESTSMDAVKNYVKPVYKKDEATQERIKDILKKNEKMQVLCGHLDDVSMQDIVNAFKDAERRQGENIIKQGDEGDCLYIINEGSVDVYVARPGPDGQLVPGEKGTKVVTLSNGALFGELALMYSAPRAATATIASPTCKLWQLDREPFKMLLAHQSHTQHSLYEGWLSEVEIFKSLNQFELSTLSDLMKSELFDDQEVIITQGEPGDCFFIIEDGTAAAYIMGAEGEKKVKEYNRQGEYFGEIALMTDEPRRATVKATGEGCTVLSVSKEDFTNVLGPIQDILKKDIDRYPQYAQFLAN